MGREIGDIYPPISKLANTRIDCIDCGNTDMINVRIGLVGDGVSFVVFMAPVAFGHSSMVWILG